MLQVFASSPLDQGREDPIFTIFTLTFSQNVIVRFMIKVSSVLIGVKDLKLSKPFYENVFDMKFNEFRPPFSSAVIDGMEFNIEENSPDRSSDWTDLYVGGRKQVAFQTENLEEFLVKAESFGAKIIKNIETRPWGWKEAIIADLDNNEFVVEQEISSG